MTYVTLSHNFKEELTFINPKGSFRKIILFLGKTSIDPKLSKEHNKFRWCSFKEACRLVQFKERKEVLQKARNYLKQRKLSS